MPEPLSPELFISDFLSILSPVLFTSSEVFSDSSFFIISVSYEFLESLLSVFSDELFVSFKLLPVSFVVVELSSEFLSTLLVSVFSVSNIISVADTASVAISELVLFSSAIFFADSAATVIATPKINITIVLTIFLLKLNFIFYILV